MKGGEDGLDEAIARALKGEIERLPPEGGNVDIRFRFKGDLVNGPKTIIVNPPRTPPPDNPNQRQCPQCGGMTWLATQGCMHCGVDLFALDAKARREDVQRRQIKVGLFFGAIAIAGMSLAKYVPADMRTWVYVAAAIAGLTAMSVMKG